MSAIDAALSTIDRVASEGDLAPERPTDLLELDVADRTDRPAGRQADLPAAAARRADRRARLLADRCRGARRVIVPAADRTARLGQEPDRPRDRLPALARPRPGG